MRRAAAALAALVAVTVPLGCSAPHEQADLADATTRLPRSSLGDDVRTGSPVNLLDYRGGAVIVVGYGSWCRPCGEALDEIAAVQARTGVPVVGLSDDPPAAAAAYAQDNGLDFPVVADPDGSLLERLAGTEVHAVPLTLVLDRRGRVVDSLAGAVLGSALDDDLAALAPRHRPQH